MNKSKLNQVIEEIKELRGKDVYIFGQPQTLKNELDLLEIDVIDVLEILKEYEININEIDMVEYNEIESGNSYNWYSPVSNHINYTTYKKDDHNIIVECRVNKYGDVRSNYTDYFYLNFTYPTEFFEALLESNRLEYIEVGGVEYNIYIDILSDTLEVNLMDGSYIGYVSACDTDELKSEIKYLVD